MADGIEVERMVESRPKKVRILNDQKLLSNCNKFLVCGPFAQEIRAFDFTFSQLRRERRTVLIVLAFYGRKTTHHK